ncbi:MAG: hypothetical protein WCP39_04750 [Chlamydiota bacterium]
MSTPITPSVNLVNKRLDNLENGKQIPLTRLLDGSTNSTASKVTHITKNLFINSGKEFCNIGLSFCQGKIPSLIGHVVQSIGYLVGGIVLGGTLLGGLPILGVYKLVGLAGLFFRSAGTHIAAFAHSMKLFVLNSLISISKNINEKAQHGLDKSVRAEEYRTMPSAAGLFEQAEAQEEAQAQRTARYADVPGVADLFEPAIAPEAPAVISTPSRWERVKGFAHLHAPEVGSVLGLAALAGLTYVQSGAWEATKGAYNTLSPMVGNATKAIAALLAVKALAPVAQYVNQTLPTVNFTRAN